MENFPLPPLPVESVPGHHRFTGILAYAKEIVRASVRPTHRITDEEHRQHLDNIFGKGNQASGAEISEEQPSPKIQTL
jgi:hypothetical protein